MQEVKYVTTVGPVAVCMPERPKEPVKEKKKVLYLEGSINSSGNDLNSIKKKIEKSEKLYLYYWALDSFTQTHYLSRHQDNNNYNSILITNYDIMQKNVNAIDASTLYDKYQMKYDDKLIEKYLKSDV